ncbi:MAG: lysophospholipase [Clostridia bacterium]|nr:lysophospholipase [Clostridia bacterium]
MPKRIDETFASVTGETLDLKIWQPDGDARAIVQIVHGMAEYIDRYDEVGRYLAENGCLAIGHTHLGHGPRAKTKGYFGERDGWQHLLDDACRAREIAAGRYAGLPVFLLGHSMGSFVARCLLMDHGGMYQGAILSGTGYFAPGKVLGGKAIARLQCLFGQGKKPSPLINQIGFATANRPFAPARTEFDWLSRDPARVDKYAADPYCGHLFTAKGYGDLFDGLNRLNRLDDLKRMPKELPVLFISGASDPVGDMGRGVRTIAAQFRTAGLSDVTVRLYDGARHELFNEINREEVFGDLLSWIGAHVPA